MLWLDRLIEAIPQDRLQYVTIQFSDPWFKRKHAKRRMVNKEMVESLATRMPPDGRVFIQTDIEALADEMFSLFRADARFTERRSPKIRSVKTNAKQRLRIKISGLPNNLPSRGLEIEQIL